MKASLSPFVYSQGNIRALIATSDTLTPQWVIQTKDVTKISLSSVEYLIGLVRYVPTINPRRVAAGVGCDSF